MTFFLSNYWRCPPSVPQSGGKLPPTYRLGAKSTRNNPAPGKAPKGKRRRQWK